MKVVAFFGSYQTQGNTRGVLEEFLKAMKETKEFNYHFIDLCREENIKSCDGCMECKFKPEIWCSQNDKGFEYIQELIEADVVIFAFPVYCDMMPGDVKRFYDRTLPFIDFTKFTVKESIREKMEKKMVVQLITCGGGSCDNAAKPIENFARVWKCKHEYLGISGGMTNETIRNDPEKMKLAYEFGKKVAAQL